jgi:hypothetical protein
MSNKKERESGLNLDRRTILKGAAVGAGIYGISGSATARGSEDPCFKDFECSDSGTYVKFDFVIDYDEDGNIVGCYFEEETDTDLISIDSYTSKEGEDCEPISVEWSVADGYLATKVMAYGGRDCVTVKDLLSTGGTFEPGLDGAGGQTAAISNLQFCVEEEECIDILADLQAGDEITGSTFGNVTITSSVAGNTIVAAEEGKDPGFYGAPNGDGSLTNGCMGETIDIGFGDINAKEAKAPQNLDFTFDNPVSEFELRMLDFGDFNPTGASKHLIEITAFNSGGMVVDSETIEYYTDGSVNPTKGYETSALSTVVYENLNVEGDACGAEEGDIGDYTFLLTGDIAKVELRFPSGHDPNIAFDLPCTSQ